MSASLKPISPVMGAAESVSSVTASNSVPVGTRWGDDSGNLYVYVYNAGTTQISQGQLAVAAPGASGYSCTVSSVSLVDQGIGIARNATLTTATYGWLMTEGFSPISTDNVSGVTGAVLLVGAAGNIGIGTTAVGSFATAMPIGKLLTSVSTGVTAAAQYLKF